MKKPFDDRQLDTLMTTASLPLKVRLKGLLPFSPRSNSDQENRRVRLQAEKLISGDSTHIIALLADLYAPQDESRRKEANKVLDLALKEYPTTIVITLTGHLQTSKVTTTRLRSAKLLLRVFRPQDNLYCRISPFYHSKIKATLFQCFVKENNPDVIKNVIDVASNVAEVLLPKKQWPELYGFIFESLKSNVSRNKVCALMLFAVLIPKCPEVFLFNIDVLSDAFKGLMDRKREDGVWGEGAIKAASYLEDRLCGVAAIKPAVALVLHLATPANHEKYYDLLLHMGRALLNNINKGDDERAQEIIEDMTVLAQKETRFLSPHIVFLVKTMLDAAETKLEVDDKMRESAIEFVVKVAENVEYGCGMIQNICPELLKRLFAILITMLSTIEEDPFWERYDIDYDCEDELSLPNSCSYAMEAIPRLVRALCENVIVRSLPDDFPVFLENISWQCRYAAITALGLIADGCPKACSGISKTFLKIIVNLCGDQHPRVRWATIQAIGQFSKNWGPYLQRELYLIFLPVLVAFMGNCNYPKLQLAATSTILLFSKKGSSETFGPHLKRILSNLCTFLQEGLFREEALTTLASLSDSFPEFEEYYDAVLGYVKVFLAMRHEKKNSMVPGKALVCMTTIAVAAGKDKFITNVDKVTETLINFQECRLDSDDPMRYHILQAWGRLSKCLGTDFVPYLSVSMRQLLDSACLQDYLKRDENSGDESIRSNVVEEKAAACEVLCSFATEFTEEIHLWMDEIISCLLPLLTFKHDARIRTHAISAMPLLFHSASSVVDKLLPFRVSIKELSYRIIPALVDALCKEKESGIQLKILEALNKCIEITGSCLDKSITDQFIKVITGVLSAYSNMKTERKRRVERGLDGREETLLLEEIEIENNIYRSIADCLCSIVNIFRASFLPMLDRLLPCLVPHWNTNSTEQRIFLHILRDVAEKCGEDAFKYYEEDLVSIWKSCDLDDPNIWQLVGYGISICAQFGGNVFTPHREAALNALQHILTHPYALHPHNLVDREIAVFALGKMCKFHFNGPDAHLGVKIWLSYLPLRNNVVEAQQMHEDLCKMVETSAEKVFGPCPQYSDYETIIKVFAQVIWSGNALATEETSNRMKKILRKFKERMLSCDFESICSSFPFPIRTALDYCLSL